MKLKKEQKSTLELFDVESIIDSSDDAILTKDLNGIIRSWNRGAEKIFGYTADEAIGKSVTMLIPFGHKNEEPEILAQIRQGKKVDHYGTIRRRKDGSLVNISITVSPIRDAVGVVIGASKIARDITIQKRVEELQLHLSAIVESSDDAILSKDLHGIIRSWNPAAERIFGYTAAEILGKPITILIPPGHDEEEPEILRRIRRGEKIDHYETVRRRKDGSLVAISVTISPIKDAKGEVIGASKIARDISEKRRAEFVQVHLAAIVESSDDAILTKDLDSIIRSWNPAAERIFGYTADEAIGKSVTMLIPAGHEDEEPKILGRIRQGEKIDHYETIRKRKDGSLVDISVTVSPIRNSKGEVIGASKIARDISFQKKAEKDASEAQEQLIKLNESLEHRVQERTAALKTAVEQMEEFSYSVSHDLRSPVRAIQGYANALNEDYSKCLDETGKAYLQKIIRGSTRMDRLILDVLIFSRVAQSNLQTSEVDLETMIKDVVEQYPELQAPNARITVQAPLAKVMAHESSLTQAFSNLLGNAVKFVAPGKTPEVDIRTELRGKTARVWITDNGIGIPPNHEQRLFRLFERANPDPKFEGTGIGLAIVKKAVEKMGGLVGYESSDAGTAFWIELMTSPATT